MTNVVLEQLAPEKEGENNSAIQYVVPGYAVLAIAVIGLPLQRVTQNLVGLSKSLGTIIQTSRGEPSSRREPSACQHTTHSLR